MVRRTLAREVTIDGIGLHRGGPASVSIRPGKQGIVFVKKGVRIPATPENVVDTRLNTTIGRDGVSVSTIEHLMSCLWGLKVTDCEVVIEGEEIPVIDGSAWPFFTRLQDAGTMDLQGEVASVRIHDLIRIEDGGSWIEAGTGPFCITYEIDFPSRAIGRQCYSYDGSDYAERIARARTFGMLRDVEMMRAAGLALGGSLDNAVVVDDEKVINPEGFRFPDECIRHKILDLLGDLWTLGMPLEGDIRAYKASHRLHIALAHEIRKAYFLEGGNGL